MYDAALYFGSLAKRKSNILDKLKIEPCNYILATIHRKNTNDRNTLNNIISAL